MTRNNSFKSQPATFKGAMLLNGLHAIHRASGNIPARSAEEWRKGILIYPNNQNQDGRCYFFDDAHGELINAVKLGLF
jgi:hypothetical protein